MKCRMRNVALPALVAMVALVAAGASVQAQGRLSGTAELDTVLTVSSGARIQLTVGSGTILVTASPDARVRISARNPSGRLDLSASGSHVSLRARGGGGGTRLEVAVPAGVRVVTESASGNTTVRDVRGDVTVGGMSGSVEITGVTGRTTVENLSGSTTIRSVTGPLRVELVSGSVTISDVSGTVDAETVSGNVTMSGIRGPNVRASSVSGTITYEGSVERTGTYQFSSHSGNVRLTLPEGIAATVSMESFSGSFRSAFPMQLEPGVTQRGEKRVFTIGGGGAAITTRSFSGNIIIERGTGREEE